MKLIGKILVGAGVAAGGYYLYRRYWPHCKETPKFKNGVLIEAATGQSLNVNSKCLCGEAAGMGPGDCRIIYTITSPDGGPWQQGGFGEENFASHLSQGILSYPNQQSTTLSGYPREVEIL